MNIELLKEVRDAILDEATPFNMNFWGVGVSQHTWWPSIGRRVGDCKTPACLAGWAVRLGRRKRRSPAPLNYDAHYSTEAISGAAASLLGLTEAGALRLFYWPNWPEWAQEMDNRTAAVALLDALIAGQNPWAD